METAQREQIHTSLQNLANSHAETMANLEHTTALISEALALGPIPQFSAGANDAGGRQGNELPVIDPAFFKVRYRAKSCFLGNTLPFRLFARLARRPNTYLTYNELLADVWNGVRSDDAIRSVVKDLRTKFRKADLSVLADAIDGSVKRHYAFRLNG